MSASVCRVLVCAHVAPDVTHPCQAGRLLAPSPPEPPVNLEGHLEGDEQSTKES